MKYSGLFVITASYEALFDHKEKFFRLQYKIEREHIDIPVKVRLDFHFQKTKTAGLDVQIRTKSL